MLSPTYLSLDYYVNMAYTLSYTTLLDIIVQDNHHTNEYALSLNVSDLIGALIAEIRIQGHNSNLTKAIDALCKLGKMDEAMLLLQEMKGRKMIPDVMHYTTLINGYCLKREPSIAFELFEEMIGNGLKLDVITFDVLAGGLARCGHFKEAIGLLDHMQAYGLEPTSVTHSLVIEGLCIGGKVKEAELYFNNTLEPKNLDLYAAMMNGYCEANYITKAFELWLSERTLVIKRASWLKLISRLCAEDETDKAFAMYKVVCSGAV